MTDISLILHSHRHANNAQRDALFVQRNRKNSAKNIIKMKIILIMTLIVIKKRIITSIRL